MKLIVGVFMIMLGHSVLAVNKINIGEYFGLEGIDFEIDDLSEADRLRLHPDAGLAIDAYLEKYNYPFESHTVTTEDGYILTVHRIPYGREESSAIKNENRPPVLLMHGLLSNSFDFINTGPERALALVLADAGYDVWVGNNRGTKWSRAHVSLDPQNLTFWDFSYHELGYYDVPALIDYILETTGAEQISYAGHSQGTTQYFAGMASRPEYNSKIKVMAALAPSAYLTHVPQPLLNLIKDYLDVIFKIGDHLRLGEILPRFERVYNFVGLHICGNEKYQWICELGFFLGCGFDADEWDIEHAPLIFMENDPSGSSYKEFKHYAQGITSDKFGQIDYGLVKNLEIYGHATPPTYDLSQITSPVALFSGKNDWLVSLVDVDRLESELSNVILRHDVLHDSFTHLDFIWSKDLFPLVNSHVLDLFNQYNNIK